MNSSTTYCFNFVSCEKSKNYSQDDLAKQSGVPRATISKIENGKRNVTIATLSHLAEALGTKLEINFVDLEKSSKHKKGS